MKNFTRCAAAAVVGAAITACAPSFEDAVATDELAIELSECDDWGCPKNSASMGEGLFFHEIDGSRELENDAGFRLHSFTIQTRKDEVVELDVEVKNDHLRGIDRQGTIYEGKDLVGAIFTLVRKDRPYYVRIADVGETTFWVDPSAVPTYTFEFTPAPSTASVGNGAAQLGHALSTASRGRDNDNDECKPDDDGKGDGKRSRKGKGDGKGDDCHEPGEFKPLCSSTAPPAPGTPAIDSAVALVFHGDRYDARAKTISDDARRWFNVACAGSAVAKMHLLRHTEAASTSSHRTKLEWRQAMLKMIVDDICGTGKSFTVNGEDVGYMDNQGWWQFDLSTMGTVESIWTEKGAICLDEPRRALEDPDVWEAVKIECGGILPPECRSLTPSWESYGYGISANPR